jgi:hypothetical protein
VLVALSKYHSPDLNQSQRLHRESPTLTAHHVNSFQQPNSQH